MKKLIFFLIILLNITSYSVDKYNFPFKNPYIASVIGSTNMMAKGVSEEVPRKEYSIKILPYEKPPEHLWYHNGFKFSLVKQKEKAPLIFVIAGTGGSYASWKMKSFERIFYDAGFHVISISSPVNSDFMVTASDIKAPGVLLNDSQEIYRAMDKAYELIKDKVEVDQFHLMGYSLGGSQAAYVSMLDDQEKKFDFKRVLMINPAVNLYESAKILDDMLDENIPGGRENIGLFLERIIKEVGKHLKNKDFELNDDTIYTSFKGDLLSEQEFAALIGIAFRIISVDLNYLGDVLNNMGIYVPKNKKIGKFESLEPYFDKINFASFIDYINNIAYPRYQEIYPDMNFQEFTAKTDIREIENYLLKTDKISIVTNRDELILTPEHLKFLEDTFKGRSIIYPLGGHCGNMYYTTNIENMIRYFQEGVLEYEN